MPLLGVHQIKVNINLWSTYVPNIFINQNTHLPYLLYIRAHKFADQYCKFSRCILRIHIIYTFRYHNQPPLFSTWRKPFDVTSSSLNVVVASSSSIHQQMMPSPPLPDSDPPSLMIVLNVATTNIPKPTAVRRPSLQLTDTTVGRISLPANARRLESRTIQVTNI